MKYYASISYDGSFFKGIAIQPNQKTVKGLFDQVLTDFFLQKVSMQLVSRTDKGVHSMDSRICFDLESKIPANKLALVLNPKLEQIQLNWVLEVSSDFLLQKQEFSKLYMYKIKFGPKYPFDQSYHWQMDHPLDHLDQLQKVLDLFLGEHDFRHFCKVDHSRNIRSFKREIQKIYYQKNGDNLTIFIQGNGFLWMMVRYIIYTVISCLRLQIKHSDIVRLLSGAEPSKVDLKSLRPAPANGLYLHSTLVIDELSL
ncbi:hypothetical protein MJH12_17665 [bacterium]|nr:hypothetical protein [bacterium]